MFNRSRKTIIFVAQFSLMGLGVALLVLLFQGNGRFSNSHGGAAGSYAPAVARAAPTVVSVHTATAVAAESNPLLDDPLFQKFFRIPDGERSPTLETSLGSGVIINSDGYILTNYHVIKEADRIRIGLLDGRVADATIVGSDPATDIAVLRIAYNGLPQITIADSSKAKVGDIVLAIGNPLGVGQTVTQGIISATGRNRIGINTFENFIQTDAAINPGNSGGALINGRGELIGINSAILGYQGIGFAIPTSIAVDIMRQLVASGSVERGWIGIDARDLSLNLRAELGAGVLSGIIVLAVMPTGPAALAGIMPGDILTRIENREIRDSQDAVEAIASLKPGDKARVIGIRAGAKIEFNATVSQRPTGIATKNK